MMTEQYKAMLKKGLEYQDFVIDKLIDSLGIVISNYSSKKYQYSIGENKQGIEIKFDDRYKETGNLYIEVAEKTNAKNENYIDSGIYRDDNSWLYVIGNYQKIFIFGKNILKLQYEKGNYKKVQTPTSKGFLLNAKGQRTALKIVEMK